MKSWNGLRAHGLLLVLSVGASLGGCDDAGPDDGKIVTGACHAVDYVPPTCTMAPAQLGTQPLGPNFFVDVFRDVGLAGHLGRRVTFGDVNGDKFPDFIALETGVVRGLQHLFVSQPGAAGGRTFVETTASSGITANRVGGDGTVVNLVAFADVDNDGDLDLYAGSYSQKPDGASFVPDPNELYINDGTGHFSLKLDSGVNLPWPLTTTAAVFLDYDHDGNLDLFVGNFEVAYPDDVNCYQDNLYRGDGHGGFTLVNDAAHITTPGTYGDADGNYVKPTYGATACDWNDDGWPDLFTSTYALGWNDLWKNNGDGTFTNDAQRTKYYMDDTPNPVEDPPRWGGNSFSAACADYDNDGDLDIMTSETTHGDAPRDSADRSRILVNTGAAGGFVFARPDLATTGINRDINAGAGSNPNGEDGNEGDHGADWLDFDNDGLLDLVIEQSAYPGNHAWLYHQLPDHSFENVTELAGTKAGMMSSNGLTVDDYDRDGDLDILMGSVNANDATGEGGVEQIHLFENRVGNQQSWLYVTLKGQTGNRQGIGARVLVTASCLTQTREIGGGKGTFGAADPAYAHFGLGTAPRVDEIEIRWPTNPVKIQKLYNVAVNQFLEITEGSDTLSCEPPQSR